jgi:hypothetical protein
VGSACALLHCVSIGGAPDEWEVRAVDLELAARLDELVERPIERGDDAPADFASGQPPTRRRCDRLGDSEGAVPAAQAAQQP